MAVLQPQHAPKASRVAESLVIGETFRGMKEMSVLARQRIEQLALTVDWIITDSRDEAAEPEKAEIARLGPTLNVAGR